MLAFILIKSMKVERTQDFSCFEVGDTVVVDTISLLADHKYCLCTSFIAYNFMKMYVFQDNSMVFIRVTDLLNQQHFNQFFRFRGMSEEIFIQQRILFCIPILILTEIFKRKG